MLLLDDILLSPISGFKFVLRTLARVAEEEYTDDTPIKERLLHLQNQLEEGAITEDEYLVQERQIMADLREVRNRKLELAGASPEPPENTAPPVVEVTTTTFAPPKPTSTTRVKPSRRKKR